MKNSMDINIDRSLVQTEEQMLARWGKYDKPLVSICCTTYNHEKYIADAIDGFLIQKTDFPFEILIRDDYSTDSTAEIVREYHADYPTVITPIFERENQYSKGVKPMPVLYGKALGKYVALCEGDDYWFDPLKLHKQIETMKEYPECNISFHPAVIKYPDGRTNIIAAHSANIKIFATEQLIVRGGSFMPTASLILRQSALPIVLDFFDRYNPPVGDYFLQIISSHKNGALFLADCMSVYNRESSPDSWSAKMETDLKYHEEWYERYFQSLEDIDSFMRYNYTFTFKKYKTKAIANMLRSKKPLELKKRIFRRSLGKKKNIKTVYFYYYYTYIINELTLLKNVIRKLLSWAYC